VIHFAAHPPSKLWPEGIAAFSHAEWVGSCAPAERKASRWCKEPCVEAIEILGGEASVMLPEDQGPRAGNLLQLRGLLVVRERLLHKNNFTKP
jgi:hypothetical protein